MTQKTRPAAKNLPEKPAKKAENQKAQAVQKKGAQKPAAASGKAPKELPGAIQKSKPVPLEKERRLKDRPSVARKNEKGAHGRKSAFEQGLCRVIGCTAPATTKGYSRACYIKYWKQIKLKEDILEQGTLQRYISELCEKYPDKTLLALKHDLHSDEAYAQMIRDLDLYGGIDELEHAQSPRNTLEEDEEAENDIDSIKKGIDKEDDLF